MKFGINTLTVYNPDTSPEAFRDGIEKRLEMVRLARDVGFKLVSLGQHFLIDPPMHNLPQTMLMLARYAADSGDMELMTSILLLPMYPPPLIAEEMATLDAICGGRFILAASIGYREEEFTAFGMSRKQRVGRFEESVHILKRLFTEDRVDHKGKYYTIPNLRLTAKSVRKPRPPIWIGTGSDPGTIRAARIADGVYSSAYLTVDQLARQRELYHKSLIENGKRPQDGTFLYRREVYLDVSRKKALEKALPALKATVANYRTMGIEGTIMPKELDTMTPETATDAVPFLVGTPEDCVEQLAKQHDRLKMDYLNLGFTVSRLPHKEVMKNIETFGKKVIPHFKD